MEQTQEKIKKEIKPIKEVVEPDKETQDLINTSQKVAEQLQRLKADSESLLIIRNVQSGMDISLASKNESMTDLLNLAWNVKVNFFKQDNKGGQSYIG